LLLQNTTSANVTLDVTITVEGTVNNMWNGTYTQTGTSLRILGVGWNSSVPPGNYNPSIGFCATR
jgi:cellulase/cellobiase CelA1